VYNFTFSNPSIRIKLIQDAPSPSPSTSPVVDTALPPTLELKPISNILKKFTITCAKGKTTKKVTAVNPKCPAGYKKK
jgi:hypothetical protein